MRFLRFTFYNERIKLRPKRHDDYYNKRSSSWQEDLRHNLSLFFLSLYSILRLLPAHIITVRITGAGIENSPFFTPFFHALRSASRAKKSGILHIGFCILTFRKSGAGKKLSVRPVLQDHLSPAFITNNIRFFFFDVDFLNLFSGLLHRLR